MHLFANAARGVSILVALALLSACAVGSGGGPDGINDPYEATNRKIHAFNRGLDRALVRPASKSYTAILPDEVDQISECLRGWIADAEVDAVLSTGGTGLTGRDVTVEAHLAVYEKHIDAFGTLFTMLSYEKIGTSAVQSRACAGVAGGTFLFALPGSPGACKDAWDAILVK